MKQKLSDKEKIEFIQLLKVRFEENMHRHPQVSWHEVEDKLMQQPQKLWSIHQMDITDGMPDVVVMGDDPSVLYYVDCVKESPKGRRSYCYDNAALQARKSHPPQDSAMQVAKSMGIDLLTEEQYRLLQEIEPFDLKTSSWVLTEESVRKLGGAIFGDRRYDRVFIYHNGADSYYSSRGFRGILQL